MEDAKEDNVLIEHSKMTIKGETISSLIAQMYDEDKGVQEGSILNYRDIVDLSMRIHDGLQKSGQCVCAGSTTGTRSRNSCFVVTPSLITSSYMRGRHFVVPEYALFDSEDAQKMIFAKKHTKPYKGIKERSLCIVSLHEEDNNVIFSHYEHSFVAKALMKARYVVHPYNDAVAKEIWDYRKKDAVSLHWDEEDKNATECTSWVGIDAYAIWPKLSENIQEPKSCNETSKYYSSSTDNQKQTTPLKKRKGKDFADTESLESLIILRDSVVLNAIRIPKLPQERDVSTPFESTVMLINTDHDRDTTFQYSIVFFEKASEGMKFARKNGFYMGAHDISPNNGAKNYFVSTTCYGAYETIRLGECTAAPQNMYSHEREGEIRSGHSTKMRFSHEYLLAERPTKLYLDIDISLCENQHLFAPVPLSQPHKLPMVEWSTVNQITLSVIHWFTEFFASIFGSSRKPDNLEEDWTVLCATDREKKISRHLILSKPGCFFQTKLDLMMFMELAQHKLVKDMHVRDRRLDNCLNEIVCGRILINKNPMSWMIKISRKIDHASKTEITSEESIIDFAVYSDYSCMRGIYCSKMKEPERILHYVDITSTLKPGQNMMFGRSQVKFQVIESNSTYPTSDELLSKDFSRWKRASIICVEPEGTRGMTLPLGNMLNIPLVVPSLMEGDDSNDAKDKTYKAKTALESFTPLCWDRTSTVEEGCKALLSVMIAEINRKGKSSGGMGSFRSWAYSCEDIRYGVDIGQCPYRMLRDYFSQENDVRIQKFVDLRPWIECEKIILTRHCDVRSKEEKQASPTSDYKPHANGKRKACYTSSHYSGAAPSLSRPMGKRRLQSGVEEKPEVKNPKDHVRVRIRWSKWCPIAGECHDSGGKVYLLIYRNGNVLCSCFMNGCQKAAKTRSETGRSKYWPLVPLSEKQKAILWP